MKTNTREEKKKLLKEIEDILTVVYENGQDGKDEKRIIFWNGYNLMGIIDEIVEKEKKEAYEKGIKDENHRIAGRIIRQLEKEE